MKKIILTLTLLATPLAAWGADYTVIVANAVPVSSMSLSDVRAIFFGNKSALNGGTAETCIWDSKSTEGLYQAALGVSKSQFSQQWVRKELTGAGRAPVIRESVDDVVACVAGSSFGIGLIPSTAAGNLGGKVKVVTVGE